MVIKFKKLNEYAIPPVKAHATDAGFDLTATSYFVDEDGCSVYGTGLAVEIPQGYVGLLFPRSSIAKKDLLLSNAVGVIDSGYRGEIMAKFKPTCIMVNPLKFWWRNCILGKDDLSLELGHIHSREYEVGDRIAQLIIMPYPEIEFEEVEDLEDSDRGTGGYGSSGQ